MDQERIDEAKEDLRIAKEKLESLKNFIRFIENDKQEVNE